MCLIGCSRGLTAGQVLAQSDSLISRQQYDSVLMVLKSIGQQVPDLSEQHQMHYMWNLAEVHYYKGESMIEDSLLPQAVSYYKEKKDTSKLQLSPLLEATYWQWKNNAGKVFKVVHDGIQDARQRGDNHQQARLYTFWAQYNYDHRRYDKAVASLQKAVQLSAGVSSSERHPMIYLLAVCYGLEGKKDMARTAYMQAVKLAQVSGDTFMAAHYLRNYASDLNEQGQTKESLAYLRQIYQHPSSYKGGLVMVTVEMAYAFLQQHQLDSAQYYVDRSVEFLHDERNTAGTDPSIRCSVYALQQLIQYGRGETPDLKDMGRYLDSVASDNIQKNSIMKQRLEMEMNLMSRNNQLVISRQRLLLWLFLAVVIIIGGASGIYLYIGKRRREMQEMEERIEALNRLVEDAGKVDDTEKTGDAFFKKILLQQLGILKVVATEPTAENQRLLRRLLSVSEDGKESEEALLAWEDLYRAIDRIYHQFYSRIKSSYGQVLLEKELKTLCLIRAGFSTKEIGVVTHQSTAMVYMRKTAIRKKLGIDMKGDILAFINSREGTETFC